MNLVQFLKENRDAYATEITRIFHDDNNEKVLVRYTDENKCDFVIMTKENGTFGDAKELQDIIGRKPLYERLGLNTIVHSKYIALDRITSSILDIITREGTDFAKNKLGTMIIPMGKEDLENLDTAVLVRVLTELVDNPRAFITIYTKLATNKWLGELIIEVSEDEEIQE